MDKGSPCELAEKGFVFSADLAVAAIAMLLLLGIALLHFDSAKENALSAGERFSLQRKTLFLADSLVKNRNTGQPNLGAAAFDPAKHRVLSNELDTGLLRKAGENAQGGSGIKEISLVQFGGKEREIFYSQESLQQDCMAVDRIVIAGGKKSIVRVTACAQ
jgi:hypothetical protein